MNILMIAIEAGRWGPARLPAELVKNGFKVYALCPRDNAVAASSHLEEFIPLSDVKSSRKFRSALREVMAGTTPCLIIPCDDQTVAALQAVARAQLSGKQTLSTSDFRVVLKSVGKPHRFDELIFKHKTLDLAQQLGIQTPKRRTVTTAAHARDIAQRMGYPVFLKSSFSWAGMGTRCCETPEDVTNAFTALDGKRKFNWVRDMLRTLLARDWYPSHSAIQVQEKLLGLPAAYCAVALEGKFLGGFSCIKVVTLDAFGPSTVMEVGSNETMANAARKFIAATGMSGFVAFDFMYDPDKKAQILIECSPRPVQVAHLGSRFGIDMCRALAQCLSGRAHRAGTGVKRATIPLFPQEWFRDEDAALKQSEHLDIPRQDEGLFQFMLAEGARRGRSASNLLAGIAR